MDREVSVCFKPLRRSLSKNQFCREENFPTRVVFLSKNFTRASLELPIKKPRPYLLLLPHKSSKPFVVASFLCSEPFCARIVQLNPSRVVQLNLLCLKERLYPHIFCLCWFLAPYHHLQPTHQCCCCCCHRHHPP